MIEYNTPKRSLYLKFIIIHTRSNNASFFIGENVLISKIVKQKWNSKNKNRYVKLGYKFTKMKDEFDVNVNDLSDGSLVTVKIKCDYCGKIYSKHYYNYLIENEKSIIHKDSCGGCKHLKAKESVNVTYNCDNVFQLDDIKSKIANTNLERYGSENPFSSEIVKEKIKNYNLDNYGVEYYSQTEISKKQHRDTFIKRYGIPFSPALLIGQQKGSLSPRWSGGAERNHLYRSTFEYNDWRKEVLIRDNYTCQCCNIHNGLGHTVKLHVHHIYNFKDNVELRHDINNGICLCKECHILFHSIYGHRYTNKNQLDEFIMNHGKKIC